MRILTRIKDGIFLWWEGEYIPPDPNGPFVMGFSKRHWSAKVVSTMAGFYLKHWQWVWSTIIAVISLYIAVLAIK